MAKVKVLYRTSKGVMAFEGRKPIFESRGMGSKLDIGLGVIHEDKMVDKEKYFFSEIENIESVLHDSYYNIEHFKNKGVPKEIYKGVYGNSVFIKEVYANVTYLKALGSNGEVLVKERDKTKANTMNVHFARLDNVITEWEDITSDVVTKVIDSISLKKSDITLNNPYILYTLRRLSRNKVVKLETGVIIADGKHESLVLWGTDLNPSMAWLGRIVNLDIKQEDISKELRSKLRENGL